MATWLDFLHPPAPDPDEPPDDPGMRMLLATCWTILALLAYSVAGGAPGGGWYASVHVGKSGLSVEAGRRAYNIRVGTLPSSTGWPDASNTGVPAGTTLTAYTGSCTITTPNTTIDSKTMDCPDGVSIQAAGVTFNKTRVSGLIRMDPDNPSYNGTWSFSIIDSEVDAGQIQQAAVCCGNVDILRSEMHGGQTGVQCEVSKWCTVQDSWLHGQYLPPDQPWHLGGFLSDGTGGSGTCTRTWCIELVHNTIHCEPPQNLVSEGCSGDLQLIPNFAQIQKVRIYHNYLRANLGSAYCTFGGDKSDATWPTAADVVYDSNTFERGESGICAAFGPVTDFGKTNPGNSWVNNTYDNGTSIPAP
jgi:hypothetical protein